MIVYVTVNRSTGYMMQCYATREKAVASLKDSAERQYKGIDVLHKNCDAGVVDVPGLERVKDEDIRREEVRQYLINHPSSLKFITDYAGSTLTSPCKIMPKNKVLIEENYD